MATSIKWYAIAGATFLVCGCAAADKHAALTAERQESNKRLVRRFYEHVVSTGDAAALPEFISPDYTEVYQGTRHPLGLDGAREHIVGVRRTYPDLRVTVERQIAEGDWVATVVTARGTHRGVWMGMRPTHKLIETTAVNIDRVIDGRIIEHGGAANLLGPMLQVGAIRVADPVSADDGGNR